MNKSCAVTGSFDPVTIGHVNIVERALKIFDKVYVLMLVNPDKDYFFSVNERLEMLKKTFKDYDRVEVAFFDGYTADFCFAHDISCLVRGVRNEKDFLYERALAKANYDYAKIETVFFDSEESLTEISSALVRELINDGKTLKGIVPDAVINTIKEKIING